MRIFSLVCLLALGSMIGSVGFAKTYTWTDENGIRHMSDNPPEDVHSYELAEIFVAKGQYEKAIAYLEDAVRIKPKNKIYKSALAEAYEKAGQLQSALVAYKQLAELEGDKPAKAKIYSYVGKIHSQLGETREALTFIEKAAVLAPTNPDILYDLAKAHEANNQKDEAIDILEKSVKTNRQHVDSLEYLGNLYFECKKDYRNTITYLSAATKLDPRRVNARVRLGTCYFKLDNRVEGVREWEEVLKIDPRNTAAQFGLGSFYAENGQHDEALSIYTQLLSLNPALAKELLAIINRERTN